MKHFLLSIFYLFTAHYLSAQQVKVLDWETHAPIENVTIYSDSNSTEVLYTNHKGIASLSVFQPSAVLFFNHLSYVEYEILKRSLKEIEYVVYLNKKSEQLEEVVLSVSKGQEKRSRIAKQVAVVSKAKIKKIAPQTSADLLANMPGVRVQKSQFGGGSPVLRGMEANRVLLVVDGVRMNNAIYRMGHLQNAISISPNILERTEVVFGPSSVIYGSDALGGVIHFYTVTPKVSLKKEVQAAIYTRYNTANNEFTKEGNIKISDKKWASYTSVSHSKYGDLTMGKNRQHGFKNWGKVFEYSNNSPYYYNANAVTNTNPRLQKHTEFSQTDMLQKFNIPLSKNTQLLFNLQYSQSSKNDRFDKLTEYKNDQLKFAEWYYGPQKRLLVASQLKINPNKKWLQKGTVTAAFQNIKESRVQRKFSSLNRSYRNESVTVFSLNGDFFVPLTKEANSRIFSYGFELTHNKVSSNAIGKKLAVQDHKIIGFSDTFTVQSRYPDGGSTYTNAAAYINYRQNLSRKATLNTGLRYVNTHLKANWEDTTFITLPSANISLNNAAITATIGYVYKPSNQWQLNTVISSGFRSPNIDDIGKVREKSEVVTVPNIYLKPEYAYSFETGVLKYFNNKQFQTGINIYYTLLNNYIARDLFELNNTSSIIYDEEQLSMTANVNKKNAYILGGTFSFRGSIKEHWFGKASFTYTKGKAYDTQLPLSSIPPLFGDFEVGFENNLFQASVLWKFNAKKRLQDYNLVEGIDNIEQTPFNTVTNNYYGNPAWSTVGIKANYKLKNNVSLFLNIDNIFDVHYKEFASAISAPGRHLLMAILIN